MSLKSENVEFVRYCGCHFENGDGKKFSNVRNLFQDIIIYPHLKCRWNRTMLNLCGIVAVILKMATARNFSILGIYSGHQNLPTYEMSLKSENVEFVRYCGGHFENSDRKKFSNVNSTLSDFNYISYVGRLWCLELIPDIENFQLVAIWKMAATIPHKFNIVWYHKNLICG
jgi:hypothetical protein